MTIIAEINTVETGKWTENLPLQKIKKTDKFLGRLATKQR